MELPSGWRIGDTKAVSPQWAEQWFEFVDQAACEADIQRLRIVLSDRRGWCVPATIRDMSRALTDRAKAIGVEITPVGSPHEEKPWHNRYREIFQKGNPDISRRMTGERE